MWRTVISFMCLWSMCNMQRVSYNCLNVNIRYVSIGRINKAGEYGPEGGDTNSWKAYNRPYLKFSLPDLWAGV